MKIELKAKPVFQKKENGEVTDQVAYWEIRPEAPEFQGWDIRPAQLYRDSKSGKWVAHIQGFGQVESAPGTPAGKQRCLQALGAHWHRQYESAKDRARQNAEYEAEKRARWEEADRIRKERTATILTALDTAKAEAERCRKAADDSWVSTGPAPETGMTLGLMHAVHLAEEYGDDWDYPLMPGPQTVTLLGAWNEAAKAYGQAQADALEFFRELGYTPDGRENVRHPLLEPRWIEPERVERLAREVKEDGTVIYKAAVPSPRGFDFVRVSVPDSDGQSETWDESEDAILAGKGDRWDGTTWISRTERGS